MDEQERPVERETTIIQTGERRGSGGAIASGSSNQRAQCKVGFSANLIERIVHHRRCYGCADIARPLHCSVFFKDCAAERAFFAVLDKPGSGVKRVPPQFCNHCGHNHVEIFEDARPDAARGAELIEAISTPTFRPYLGTDLLGAEIGGAVKNVLAIACGIALGKGLGRSAHAALIARGYAEMTRLALALGADPETLTGLSGLGDLVLTCSSETSRNMSLGLALGKGEALADVLGSRNCVTEGVATASVLRQLARRRGVEMPICEAVAAVVEGTITVDEAIVALLARPVTTETAST